MSENKESTAHRYVLILTTEMAKDPDKFREWNAKMLAYSRKKKVEIYFKSDISIPALTAITASNASADDIKVFDDHQEAYDILIHRTTGVPFAFVCKETNAYKAYTKLTDKYQPKQESDLIRLTNEFNKCVLEDTDEDPDVFFIRLDNLNERFTAIKAEYTKKDHELKAHLLVSLPDDYDIVLTVISGKKAGYSYEDMKEKIQEYWKVNFEQDTTTKKKSHLALATQTRGNGSNWKNFKGTCNKCGKQGHKAVDCWSKKTGNGGGGQGGRQGGNGSDNRKCYNCNKIGHISRNCPAKKANEQGMFCGVTSTAALCERTQEVTYEPMDVTMDVHCEAFSDEYN